MELPIYIDGVQEGTLTLERETGGILVQARMRDVGRVVRLWLYGEKAVYLGIPEPENGQQVLQRHIGGQALKDFPAHPSYGAEKPLGQDVEEWKDTPRGRHVIWQGGKPYFFR